MRVAFFSEAYEPYVNGVVVLMKAYRQHLEARGHEVFVFAPRHPGHRDRDDHVVRLPSIVWSRLGYPCLRPFSGAEEEFLRRGIDLIHSHHPFTAGYVAERLSRRYGVPLVYTFHTLLTDYACYVPLPQGLVQRALVAVIRRHCSRAHRVTVTTTLMRTWLREHGVETPISVVAPGHLPAPPEPGARERVRARMGLPQDVPVLLYAGRLAPEKQVDLLLRASAALPRHLDFRVLLVGGGPSEEYLSGLASELGLADRVVFAGVVPHDEISNYYAAGDVFVFPSTSDTLGLVLVEAMGAGLPCVAVAVNGPCEVVEDSVTGFLTPFRAPEFAAAMRRLLEDAPLRARMGAAARRRCHALWVAGAADQLLEAYAAAQASCAGRTTWWSEPGRGMPPRVHR